MDAIVQTSAIELAYSALLLEARSRPFEWGVHDCGTFAFAAVKARTGRDLLEPPTWRTAAEYARAIDAMGGLRAAVTAKLGEPVAPLRARLGDIALLQDPSGRELLGVCHGNVILCPAEAGLSFAPMTAAVCVWRVQ